MFVTKPVIFQSPYQLDESVRRLAAALKEAETGFGQGPVFVGEANERVVEVQRLSRYSENWFNPYFLGHFEQIDSKTVLKGVFTTHWIVKLFLAGWTLFSFIWIAFGLLVLLVSQSAAWMFLLSGLVILVSGLAFYKIGTFNSKTHISLISEFIDRTISH